MTELKESDMVPRFGIVALAAALATAAASPAMAHHSFAMFDRARHVTLAGTIKSFQFANPHSSIELTVMTPAGGTEEWTIEALSPNVLIRSGWKRSSLVAGQKVTVVFNPMRDGSHGGRLVSVMLPDGATLSAGEA